MKYIGWCLLAMWTLGVRAETFQLNDGRNLTGDLLLSSANDAGVKAVVRAGVVYSAIGRSSKPTIEISPGTSIPM